MWMRWCDWRVHDRKHASYWAGADTATVARPNSDRCCNSFATSRRTNTAGAWRRRKIATAIAMSKDTVGKSKYQHRRREVGVRIGGLKIKKRKYTLLDRYSRDQF